MSREAKFTAILLAKLAVAWESAHDLATEYLLGMGVRYWVSPGRDAITCVKCRRTSRNPGDVENLYCGFCHVFLEQGGRPAAGRS